MGSEDYPICQSISALASISIQRLIFIVTIWTIELLMFIYCKMAPGLYPADACQECPPELPRLSSTEDKQTFASDHTDFMKTTASSNREQTFASDHTDFMETTASSNREVGAVGQEQ